MKTNRWFNRNRLLSHLRIATAGTFISAAAAMALVATAPAYSASAEQQQFTIVYRFISISQDGDKVSITAEGQGHSRLLGAFTVTAEATETLGSDACDPVSVDLIITPERGGGTLSIREDDLNCMTEITGDWHVTGGTGQFSSASGGGMIRGFGNFTGRVVNRYTGSLSF